GPVDLVPDGADHREARGEDGLGDALLVEGPQVFQTAAAAADDQQVNAADAVEPADGLGDFQAGPVALHRHRADPDFCGRPSPPQDLQHVAHRRPGRAGDQHHTAGEARQFLLPLRVEVAANRELFLELPERQLQRADALGLQLLDLQLVLAARHVHAEPAAGDHLHAVAQVELQPQVDAAIDYGLELGFCVFEG